MEYDLNHAVFTYTISSKIMDCFQYHLPMDTQNITINYTGATTIYHASKNGNEIIIIGLCVDAYAIISREDIVFELIDLDEQNIDSIYQFSNRLAGKYVIVYSNAIGCYVFGDATCSIPINYSGSIQLGNICISPFDKMTAEYFGYKPDLRLQKMRESADSAQAMPGELTPYSEVRALLPNQYLNIIVGEPIRQTIEFPTLSFEDIIDRSIFLSTNIAKQFACYYQIICPLTSGYDSRVVLAIMRHANIDIECFTTRFTSPDENSDLRIAVDICNRKTIQHSTFGYDDIPPQYEMSVHNIAGYSNSTQTIKEAYNYIRQAGEKARINGNIIGQIGKSSVMNCVPEKIVTASFLTCKIHNKDIQCHREMKKYLSELKKSGRCVCDLFAWENRCGRWGGQEEALYSACGMNSLNIFNCRELIIHWMAVPRKQRTQNKIHLEMIKRTESDLLIEPFNPDDKYTFIRNNWLFYYFATFAKQMLIKYR